MALEIVWRNPTPPAKREKQVEPAAVDEFGPLYVVHDADKTTAFRVILGGDSLNENDERRHQAMAATKTL